MKNIFLLFVAMLLSTTSYNQSMSTSILGVTMPSTSINTNFSEQTPPKGDQIQFFENGWFVDGLVGFNGLNRNGWGTGWGGNGWGGLRPGFAITLGARFGHKWYLGGVKKWKFGVEGTFARLGISFGFPDVDGNGGVYSNFALHIAPSAGFINAIQFNEKFGLEANLNIGFNLLMSFWGYTNGNYREDATVVQPGLIVNPCAKFRIKDFAVGIDVAILYAAPGPYTVVDNNGNRGNANAGPAILSIIGFTVGKVF